MDHASQDPNQIETLAPKRRQARKIFSRSEKVDSAFVAPMAQ